MPGAVLGLRGDLAIYPTIRDTLGSAKGELGPSWSRGSHPPGIPGQGRRTTREALTSGVKSKGVPNYPAIEMRVLGVPGWLSR